MTAELRRAEAAGLVAGVVADALLGDPRPGHPVALFGRLAQASERRLWCHSRAVGALHVVLLGGAVLGLSSLALRLTGAQRQRALLMAAAAWASLGGTTLAREAEAMARSLERGELAAARRRLPHLCSRDPEALDGRGIAVATVESVAENTSDAVVAPLLWGACAGLPGLLGYRAVNTLDAMIGHRSPRYSRFGWSAARLDDLANWVPARITGLAAAAVARLVGGSPQCVLRVVRRDAGRHPSPNAGVVEAAFAGALGIRLGGRNVYGGQAEDRGTLGDGPAAVVADIARANRLGRAVSLVALAVAVMIRSGQPWR